MCLNDKMKSHEVIMNNETEFLTIDGFANKVNLHAQTVRRCIKSGKIQAINLGNGKKKIYRIPISEIQRLAIFDLKAMLKLINEEKL